MIPLTLHCLLAVLVVEQLVLVRWDAAEALTPDGQAAPERFVIWLARTAGGIAIGVLGAIAAAAGVCLLVWHAAGCRRPRRTRRGRGTPRPGGRGRRVSDGVAGSAGAVLVCAACAGMVAVSAAHAGAALSKRLSSCPVSSLEFVVASDPSLGQSGYRCRCRVVTGGSEAGDLWLTCDERLSLGDRVRCVGRFKPLQDDEWGRSCRAEGIWGTVRCVRLLEVTPASGPLGLVMRLRKAVSDSFDPTSSDARALLDGCVTGTRDAMAERGCDELFRICGVSHLVAVSGGHLAVVSSVASVLLEAAGLGPGVRSAALILATGLFVVFCGAPVSAVRSWVMVVVATGARLAGRRSHGLSSVCAVGLAMALLDPSLSGQLAFTLSVSSVVGLCLFSGYASYALEQLFPMPPLPRPLRARCQRPFGRLWRGLRDALAATLVAQAATAPLTARAFGDVSLVAPLANVLLGLPFEALVATGLLAACLVWCPPLQHACLAVSDLEGGVVMLVVGNLSKLPMASVSLGDRALVPALVAVGALAVLLVVWPRVRPRVVWPACGAIAACLALVVLRWRWFAPPRICVLDVGQGDAILVQDGGSAVLVDAGPEGAIDEALASQHVLHLDAVIVTHLHDDHYGGVLDLVGSVGCERVYVGWGAAPNERDELREAVSRLTGRDSAELAYGDTVAVGGFELRVVSPAGSAPGTSNGDSLVMSVSYRGSRGTLSALLTGDAEEDQLRAVIARGDAGDVDLLKVGHHGSEVSISPDEAAELDPDVSVASAGEGNSYGHPRQECVGALEESGSWFLCTKDVGTVEVRPGPEGVRVSCERASGASAGG